MLKDILLLEPDYKTKYPPLGLMKISYYHKKIKKDYVIFAKGKLPEKIKDKKFDRIYISTLFTYEWEETIRAIQYAKTLLKKKEEYRTRIFIGGIAATLLAEDIEKETGIKPIKGRLNEKGKIGYEDDDIIDNITPDYSILDEVDYKYPNSDAYFAFMTRGCIMGCEFCAVSTLEPEYENYISIKKQIENIDKEYGPKRNLLLMDNNVLLSPCFNKIVEEIKEIGFYKGATYINPKTGKEVKRYVDFNQGLDANLLTEEKVKKLSELAIRPARIAFDHIEDKETYIKAVKRCAKYGINYMSNYVLYNGEEFIAKKKKYDADRPVDLYKRLKIAVDLMRELNQKRDENEKVYIYSFPMKYIPLEAKGRNSADKHIGKYWNEKYLRAVQVILIPTMGLGVSGRDGFFEAAFGKDEEEFEMILMMPESIIANRGHFVEKKNDLNWENHFKEWKNNQKIRIKWEELYKNISKDELLEIISDNKFTVEKYFTISNINLKKIYLFYLSNYKLLCLFEKILKDNLKEEINFIYNFFIEECTPLLFNLSKYIYEKRVAHKLISVYLVFFKEKGLNWLFKHWINYNFTDNSNFIERLIEGMLLIDRKYFDVNILKCISEFLLYECINEEDKKELSSYLLKLSEPGILNILSKSYYNYEKVILSKSSNLMESSTILKGIKEIIMKQLQL